MSSKDLKNHTHRFKMSLRSMELIVIDILIISAAWFFMKYISSFASSMHVNGELNFTTYIPIVVLIIIIRLSFGLYNSVIRYADAKLYLKLIISDFSAGSIYCAVGLWLYQPIYLGFTYTFILFILIAVLTLISRLIYQIAYASMNMASDDKTLKNMLFRDKNSIHKINVAIVGAGNVGASLAAELIRNPKSQYAPYCFVDKDARKIGSGINGIRIYPEDEYIIDTLNSMPIQEIIIAIPDASAENKERLYNLYKKTDLKVKIYDYPLGESPEDKNEEGGERRLREFKIEDLLFRDIHKVKSAQAKNYYHGKRILVTGGGGSIGSELCRQIAKLKPAKLIILDIYENNAYEIQQELIRKYGVYDKTTKEGINVETVIASVRDLERLEEIFEETKPEIVFHAAAHKHVPLMEHSGCEALKNNVFGTYNVANVSEKYGVEKFLLISTDKAVNPTNIMGASKRLCEMIIQCRTDSKTEFTAVRFGNVLGSNGSVIPLFKQQIENGGPITITDKRIIRYFMTIPEAVGLVMETCAMAKNGELFVLDMGKPVKILDLAENMIKLSGLKPYEDIDIVEIGLRPGEKLYEELLMKTEELDKTDNELIFVERDKGLSRDEVREKLDILERAIARKNANKDNYAGHHDSVIEAIKKTVPTYHAPEELNKVAEQTDEMIRAMGGDREAVDVPFNSFVEAAATAE